MARIVVYCQHLTGLGHIVRSRQIVRTLANRHEVHFVTGGRATPGLDAPPGSESLPLPAIERAPGGLAPVDPDLDLDHVLGERRRILSAAVERLRPDVFIIEHFPFSKWALRPELLPAIERARAVNPGVKILCSLRDIARRSRFDGTGATANDPGAAPSDPSAGPPRYAEEVLPVLNRWFDALLVHGDPALTRLDDQIDWVNEIEVPILYTGYVVEALGDRPAPPPTEEGIVLLSAGGGREAYDLVRPVLDAWSTARNHPSMGERRLVVFTGPYVGADEYRDLERRCQDVGGELRRFTPDFLQWMAAADLSVSRAGYNTCANVLVARARAILVPSPRMSDQALRAHRLGERGLVEVIDPDHLTPERMAAAIVNGLDRSPPEPDLALDGAARTKAIVEALVANRTPIGI